MPTNSDDGLPHWTFLTNHGLILMCIARDPQSRSRDVAALIGITERTVVRIIDDLVQAGYLIRTREGRRNRFEVCTYRPLRHPVEGEQNIGTLLQHLLADEFRATHH